MSCRAKECKVCGEANNIHATACSSCSTSFRKRGRPHNTTQEALSDDGHPRNTRLHPEFNSSIQLPGVWNHSNELVNVDDELLDTCARRIAQQRTFDKKPLGLAVCYGCGHMLWSCVDGAHTFLVNRPSDMSKDEAPASAYLQAVPTCTAGFVYTERGTSTKERWYSCGYCKSGQIPPEQHVGNVFDASSVVKPINEWDMSFPTEIVSSKPV